MKRIAIFAGSDLRSFAGGRYIIELTKRLKDFDSTIFSPTDAPKQYLSKEQLSSMTSASFVYYNTFRFPITKENTPLTSSGIRALSNLANFDVVYLTDSSVFVILCATLICRLHNVRLVWGMHDPGALREKSLSNTTFTNALMSAYNAIKFWAIRRIPNVHALNDSDRKRLMQIGYNGRIYRINNFTYYKINSKDIKVNTHKFIALFVGRLSIKQKGIDLLGKIISDTLEESKGPQFNILGGVGDTEGKPIILDLIKKHPSNVKSYDFVSPNELINQYKDASLMLMTSRFEGMPAVLLEAQSYGLPVIAFKIKGVTEIIANKDQGKLINIFNVELFSKAVLEYRDAWVSSKKNYLGLKRQIAHTINLRFGEDVVIPKIRGMLLDQRE